MTHAHNEPLRLNKKPNSNPKKRISVIAINLPGKSGASARIIQLGKWMATKSVAVRTFAAQNFIVRANACSKKPRKAISSIIVATLIAVNHASNGAALELMPPLTIETRPKTKAA